MIVYANLLLIEVEDPSFGLAFVELAAVDPVAAKAVAQLADLDRDGARAVSWPHVIFREGATATLEVSGEWKIDWTLRAPPEALNVNVEITLDGDDWREAPVTWTGAVPIGEALETRTISPGWILAVETSVAPDSETASLWWKESADRVNALVEAYDIRSPRARSRAVAELLASAGGPLTW